MCGFVLFHCCFRSLDDARLLLEAPDLLGPSDVSIQGKVQWCAQFKYQQLVKSIVLECSRLFKLFKKAV